MHVDGSCHCGAIRFEAEIEPKRVGICHCTDCQTFSSSAFRTGVFVKGDDFKVIAGEPTIYEKIAESGSPRGLAFCSNCGTHLYGLTVNDASRFYSVRVGTLAQRDELPPHAQVWCRSAVPWLADLSNIREIETQ